MNWPLLHIVLTRPLPGPAGGSGAPLLSRTWFCPPQVFSEVSSVSSWCCSVSRRCGTQTSLLKPGSRTPRVVIVGSWVAARREEAAGIDDLQLDS